MLYFFNTVTFDDGYVSAQDDYFQTIFDSTGSSNGGSGGTGNTTYALCAFDKPVTYVAIPDTASARQGSCAAAKQEADFIGQLLFSQVRDSLIANFDSLYRAKCLSAQSTEVFSVKYQPKEYHYTLYYYDGAGNLVKTIPPAAVKPNFDATYLANVKMARANGTDNANPQNNEAMATQYRYNTLNAVIAQKSPDGGTSNTWYDRLGRLAVSQNARQKAVGNYTYVLYDALGRATEVGQKPQTTAMIQDISVDTTALKNWLNGGGTKEQITRTVYDEAYPQGIINSYITQLNLRNRVSYVQAIDVDNGTYRAATYYSYDVHGNADTVLHDYGSGTVMDDVAGNRFKLIKYNYDLISGKVNMLSYQPNKADGYYQQYQYDAENRLTMVWTSRDSILWQRDATYHYYRHGPLARMELGDLQVQGVDYAYTMQGWLKSLNPSYNNLSGDLYDEDGVATPLFARDAYKLNLHYYDDGVYTDYKPIAPPTGYVQGNTLPSSARKNLYNGNISSIATNIRALNQPLLYNYQYDQLNRLVTMDAWASNGLFAATGTAALPDYAERYTYDPNGNILTNKRWGKNRQLDDATYHYVADKNQLAYISDVAGNPTSNDIEGSQTATNYGFDPIGEMTSDTKRGLTNATWTVYGKIATQQVSNGTASGTITYTYDAIQNRISKTLTGTGGYTEWYVRDAQGNVLSIYRAGDNTLNNGHLTQTEVDVYGSSRMGELNATLDVSQNLTQPLQTIFTRGNKTFELTEQRGNVLATISDKKLQVTTDNQTVAYDTADVITAQDYSSFGVIHDGRQYGNTPRFTYNGKQLDRELNWQDYGMRESDPITGRFTSVDPLFKTYPWNSTYAFAENDIIRSIDIDGLEKYIIHMRSFAPWNLFGSAPYGKPYSGDNRGFSVSTASDVTSRIYQNVTVDIGAGKIIGDYGTKSDDTHGPRNFYGKKATGNATPDNVGKAQYKDMGNGGVLSTEMRGHNPIIAGSPDIAWKSNLNLIYNKEKGELTVAGNFSGKGFPAFEGFIEDEKGQKAFLGTWGVESVKQITKLIDNSNNSETIDVVGFSFSVDKDGKFTGVNIDLGKEKKQLTIEQWNSAFEKQPASKDCNGNCGTQKQ